MRTIKMINMKRLISLLLCFAMVLAITPGMAYADTDRDGVEINETNFPDATFRKYVSDSIDYDSDGSLSDYEINRTSGIDLSYVEPKITTLKGVEYFTKITFLDCEGHDLTELDLSRNTALEKIHCGWNGLTKLILPNNNVLTYLDCNSCSLTELTIPNGSAIEILICSGNNLGTLDVSNCTSLKRLECSGDKLKELDVSGCLALINLDCFHNQLTKLDVSNNTALTILDCSFNQLTEVDVSNNTALALLACENNQLIELDVANNVNLQTLNCGPFNQLTELDLSNNTILAILNCSYNKLTTLNLPNATTLTTVRCESNLLEGLDISGNPSLRYLCCQFNEIDKLDITSCPLLVDAYYKGSVTDDYYYSYNYKPENDWTCCLEVDYSTDIISPNIDRVAGKNRFLTAIEAAEWLKEDQSIESFPNIVIASGTDFPDALAGAYLAIVKDAPVLLTNAGFAPTLAEYLKSNLQPGGTVYILGGKGAVPEVMETELQKQGITNIERLAGTNRYLTNIEILKAAGVTGKNLLICSGTGYADSLSASALGKPILLVGNSLTQEQKDFLTEVKEDMSGDFFVLGGKGAVSEEVFNEVQAYAKGTTERVSGANRFATSVAIAQRFLPGSVDTAVLAYAMNYPDGLAGGPVAYAKQSPLLLVTEASASDAKAYVKQVGAQNIIIIGGKALIPHYVARDMLV